MYPVFLLEQLRARGFLVEEHFWDSPLRELQDGDIDVLYMTGHREFTLSKDERRALRLFLESGGTLVATACCSDARFDRAFRKQLMRTLPRSELRRLPQHSPLYAEPDRIDAVLLRTAYRGGENRTVRPELEVMALDDRVAVIYSCADLACAWTGQRDRHAMLCRGVATVDALRIGVNIFCFADK